MKKLTSESCPLTARERYNDNLAQVMSGQSVRFVCVKKPGFTKGKCYERENIFSRNKCARLIHKIYLVLVSRNFILYIKGRKILESKIG